VELRKGPVEDMVKSVFAGRRIFVTGHTGFKGGWLSLSLARLGALVRGYALDPVTEPNLFSSGRIGSLVDDVRGDIRDAVKLDGALREFAPEIVFHLAAQPLVRRSYVDPVGTYAINVLGTANLLESIRILPSVRAVVVVTTDKCYLNREWRWGYRETDPLGGHDPYSSSKACAEILCASYRSSFFSPESAEHKVLLATARAGNVIGGGDWSEDRLIPDLIRGFIEGEPVPIRRPQSVRPWQHVLEPIAGYLLLAEKLLAGDERFTDAWNFGPWDDDAWPVERIATAMARRWGGGATWFRDGHQSVHEAGLLKLDSSKARAELGWQPRLRLDIALEWLVDWYQAWQGGAEMQSFTLKQIAEYAQAGAPSLPEEASEAAAASSHSMRSFSENATSK
jgi:CDP-glucose 4,6-dehydratase